jgi:hypothetical protein
MSMRQEQLPWQPEVVLSGRTMYEIDVERAMVLAHIDEWDSADHNNFFSVSASQPYLSSKPFPLKDKHMREFKQSTMTH